MHRAAALALVLTACTASTSPTPGGEVPHDRLPPAITVVESDAGTTYVPWVPQRASCERCYADCTSACHDQGGYVEPAGDDLYCCSR